MVTIAARKLSKDASRARVDTCVVRVSACNTRAAEALITDTGHDTNAAILSTRRSDLAMISQFGGDCARHVISTNAALAGA